MNKNAILIGLLVLFGFFAAFGESQTIAAQSSLLKEPTYAISNSDANDRWGYGEYPYREQSNRQGLIRVHGILQHKNADVVGSKMGQALSTPIGTFEWRGQLGESASDGGSGWRLVKNPLQTK